MEDSVDKTWNLGRGTNPEVLRLREREAPDQGLRRILSQDVEVLGATRAGERSALQ